MTARRGFSVVELAIVVVIGGVLASLALPAFRKYQLDAKRAEVDQNVSGICKALGIYHQLHDSAVGTADVNPRSLGALDQSLVAWVPGEPGWTELQYQPDGKVRGTYFVHDDSENTPGDWYVRGSSDIDEDGFAYQSYCYGPAWMAGAGSTAAIASAIPLSGSGSGWKAAAGQGAKQAKALAPQLKNADFADTAGWANFYKAKNKAHAQFYEGALDNLLDDPKGHSLSPKEIRSRARRDARRAKGKRGEKHVAQQVAELAYHQSFLDTIAIEEDRLRSLVRKRQRDARQASLDYNNGDIGYAEYLAFIQRMNGAMDALAALGQTDADLARQAQRHHKQAKKHERKADRWEQAAKRAERAAKRTSDPAQRQDLLDDAAAARRSAQRHAQKALGHQQMSEGKRQGRDHNLAELVEWSRNIIDCFDVAWGDPETARPGAPVAGLNPVAGGIQRSDYHVEVAFGRVPKAKNFQPNPLWY